DIISGVEEARLIHLGVLQAVPVFDRRVVVIDVGGGSTEIVIGKAGDMLAARSFKVGAVRLTDRWFPDGRVRKRAIAQCRHDVAAVLSHFETEVTAHGFDAAVASSGTAESVARMVHAASGDDELRTYNCFEFTADDLRRVVDTLCTYETADERRTV